MFAALLVIDVQKGFDDRDHWGPRNNPMCEANIAALLRQWRERALPVVLVRHDSNDPKSPLRPGQPGNEFRDLLNGPAAVTIEKSVNSAFHGMPRLHPWLQQRKIRTLVVCGVTTNHCCETTARVAGNLGYDVRFVIDATHTHDLHTRDGETFTADLVAKMTAANLDGEFASVCSTQSVLRQE